MCLKRLFFVVVGIMYVQVESSKEGSRRHAQGAGRSQSRDPVFIALQRLQEQGDSANCLEKPSTCH